MADAPIAAIGRTGPRPFTPPDMGDATKAAEAARMGTERQRTLELRKVCMAYAMKLAEGKETSAEDIIGDASRLYAFFAPED